MVGAILNGLLRFFLWIIGLVSSIVFYPTQVLLVYLFPDVGSWLADVMDFFIINVFPFICFLRNFFLNVTYMPEALFMLLVDTFFIFIVVAISLRTFMLIIRVYYLVRGAKTK